MLAKRVIPCLDVDAGRVVKGVRFQELRDAGEPVQLAAHYDRAGADELVFLDITATLEERKATLDVVSRTARRSSSRSPWAGGSARTSTWTRSCERGPTR